MDRQAGSVTNCRKLAEGVEFFDYCKKIPEGGKFFDFRVMVPLTAKEEVGRFAPTQKGGGPHEHIRVRPDSRYHFGGACACRLSWEKEQEARRRRRSQRPVGLLRERLRGLGYESRDADVEVQDHHQGDERGHKERHDG